MIYTKFGHNCEIVSGNMGNGEVDVLIEGESKVFKTYLYELRADDGINEIEAAIHKANEAMKVPPLHARLNKDTRKKLEELAEYHNRSITNMVVTLIHEAHRQIKKD